MSKLKIAVLLLVAGLLLAIPACQAAGPTVEKPATLIFSTGKPRDWQALGWYEPFGQAVEQSSGGRIKVEYYHAGVLGKATEHYEMCKEGTADIIFTVPGYQSCVTHGLEITNLPGLAPNVEIAIRLNNAMIDAGYFDWDFPPEYFHILAACGVDPGQIFFREKKVTKAEDFKGLKIRALGWVDATFLQALGATPISMPGIEVYEALSKGVIDGAFTTYGLAPGYRINEPSKYVTDISLYAWSASIFVMNRAKYDSLPGDLQKIVDQEAKNVLVERAVELWKTQVDDAIAEMKAGGLEFVSLDPGERERIADMTSKPMFEVWKEAAEKQGIPVDDMLAEAIKISKELGASPPSYEF